MIFTNILTQKDREQKVRGRGFNIPGGGGGGVQRGGEMPFFKYYVQASGEVLGEVSLKINVSNMSVFQEKRPSKSKYSKYDIHIYKRQNVKDLSQKFIVQSALMDTLK